MHAWQEPTIDLHAYLHGGFCSGLPRFKNADGTKKIDIFATWWSSFQRVEFNQPLFAETLPCESAFDLHAELRSVATYEEFLEAFGRYEDCVLVMWGPTERKVVKRIVGFLLAARKERKAFHFVFLMQHDDYPCAFLAFKDIFYNATVGKDSDHHGRSVRTEITWLKEPAYIVSLGKEWPLRHSERRVFTHMESMPYQGECWRGERVLT